jgi:hypothetical protein
MRVRWHVAGYEDVAIGDKIIEEGAKVLFGGYLKDGKDYTVFLHG